MPMDEQKNQKVAKKRLFVVTRKKLFLAIVWLLFCAGFYVFFSAQAPRQKEDRMFTVEKGMSVALITQKAADEGIVQSGVLLYAVLHYMFDSSTIYAGRYNFTYPYTVFDVAKKLAQNDINPELVSLTIPEGVARKEIAEIALTKNQNFNSDQFLSETKDKEGYLFPETYFLSPEFTAEELLAFFETTYEEKITPLRTSIASSTYTEYEVLILASILERETNSMESMKMVAGILENRMKIGMALQVDASLEYILNKPLKELTPLDLKIDSPYNTYLYKDLPPTPIGNPGIDAITAILNPTKSSYYYYITDTEGEFHYAETFEEHKLNIQKYLR
jgi:UPF0755 protein